MIRAPLKRRKPRKRPDSDPKYLRFIRTLPCLLCWTGYQVSITEAAHSGPHGLGQKAPDKSAIPLCEMHHRTGPTAYHALGRKFFTHHGIVRVDIVAALNTLYDGQTI